MSQVVLRLHEVTKAYEGFNVLSDISVDVQAGECLAVVGENGAGKSTLMKLITGLELPSSGEVYLGDPLTHVVSTRNARHQGGVLIPQELAYVPAQSVANNVNLGEWPSRIGFIRRRETNAKALAVMRRLGGPAVQTKMSSLTLSQRQIVEVGKAFATRNLKLLCLDEPTAALNASETRGLLELLSRLKNDGVALIYVSHRLEELRQVADRVMVLRNGRNVALRDIATVTAPLLASLMLGLSSSDEATISPPSGPQSARLRSDGAAVPELSVSDLWSRADPQLRGVSFEARAGEIVGLYGLAGSGVESVARGLGGLIPRSQLQGRLSLRGRARSPFGSPAEARRNHVVLLPSDRAREGLLLSRPLGESLTLGQLNRVSRFGFIQRKRERDLDAKAIENFQIAARAGTVGRLSGGNQQKVLLANRLSMAPNVLVLHEPTRGVDVGARAQIHDVIRQVAREEKAVILATTDIDEVISVSDRILVLQYGKIVKELTGTERNEGNVLAWAAQGRAGEDEYKVL